MKSMWRDGSHRREVELRPLGEGRFEVRVDDAVLEVRAEALPDGRMRLEDEAGGTTAEVTASGTRRFVRLGTLEFVLERESDNRRRAAAAHGAGLEAPMPGVVTRVLVSVGDQVRRGQALVALEAMKMEHLIRAPYDGRVTAIAAAPGAMVQGGTALVEVEEGGTET